MCKLFNTFLTPTVECLSLLYTFFEEVALVKPNQSRPANSEKYVVAKGFKGLGEGETAEFLYRVNDVFGEAMDNDKVSFFFFLFFLIIFIFFCFLFFS